MKSVLYIMEEDIGLVEKYNNIWRFQFFLLPLSHDNRYIPYNTRNHSYSRAYQSNN